MTDWRDQASCGRWSKIDLAKMPHEEREELSEIVSAQVPVVKLGDGTEEIEDYLPIQFARNTREEEAIQLIADLRGWCVFAASGPQDIRSINHPESRAVAEELLFDEGISLALKTLEDAGIFLEWPGVDWRGVDWPEDLAEVAIRQGWTSFGGLFGTIVYIGRGGGWQTLHPDKALMIAARRDAVSHKFAQRTLEWSDWRAWLDRYPWRRCHSLILAHRLGWLGVNTPEDHAIRFLRLMWRLHEDRSGSNGGSKCDDMRAFSFTSSVSVETIARVAFAAGAHFEALRKKPVEYEAVKARQGIERNRINGAKGGQAEKKAERYALLHRLARQNLEKFTFASDMQALRNAKALARKHDSAADPKLFHDAYGRLLSDRWFKDWLGEFRHSLRGYSKDSIG